MVPLPTNEFIVILLFKTCMFSSFILVIISISSFECTFIFTSSATFIEIFLPLRTLHSIDLIVVFISALIDAVISGTFIVSEKSIPVFNPLILSFSPSAKYIIYVKIFPSILIFPSIISFLYMHTFPLVFTVFKISGFESGTIISP